MAVYGSGACYPRLASHHHGCAVAIVDAKLHPVVVAEGELIHVLLKVALTDVVELPLMPRFSNEKNPSAVFVVTLPRVSGCDAAF